MPKLLLINPVNPVKTGLTINESSRFPPLGLGIIAALTPSDWEIKILDENWETFFYEEADLVGLTAFTASANRAYEIAGMYRQNQIPVVMGGIHASMCAEEALIFVDAVVIGEAENVWSQLIMDYLSGEMKQTYQGELSDLSNQPQPRNDLFDPGYIFASVQTSRGCPMDCEFCSVTSFNGHRYRRRPVEDVLSEMENISQTMLFIIDDNIIGYGKRDKEQALALFKGMVERKLNKKWFCQASLNFVDDEEVLHWAGKAGCKMVFLGLESEEVDGLENINKKLNLHLGMDAYTRIFKRINKAGIAVLGAFILGLDTDTKEKLADRADYMIRSGVDVMQTTILTPLPGTRLYKQFKEEGRLSYTNYPRDWDHYDMTEVIFTPKQMSKDELARASNAIQDELYANKMLFSKALRTLFKTLDPLTMMMAYSSNINYRNVHRGLQK